MAGSHSSARSAPSTSGGRRVTSHSCSSRCACSRATRDGGRVQLDDELARNDWYVVDASPDDMFTSAPGALWRDVLRRQRGDLAMVANFPLDPSVN